MPRKKKPIYWTMTKKEALSYLENNVFNLEFFGIHIKQAAFNLDLEESVVRDVMENFIYNVFCILCTVQKYRTKINILGYFSFEVEKGHNP